MVHDGDAGEALVLSLADIEQRNDGSLLVLRWIALDHFFGFGFVFGCELERDLRARHLSA